MRQQLATVLAVLLAAAGIVYALVMVASDLRHVSDELDLVAHDMSTMSDDVHSIADDVNAIADALAGDADDDEPQQSTAATLGGASTAHRKAVGAHRRISPRLRKPVLRRASAVRRGL
jgi:hypothetical protein